MTTVDLRDIRVDATKETALAEALKVNRNITSINLNGNQISAEILQEIKSSVEKNRKNISVIIKTLETPGEIIDLKSLNSSLLGVIDVIKKEKNEKAFSRLMELAISNFSAMNPHAEGEDGSKIALPLEVWLKIAKQFTISGHYDPKLIDFIRMCFGDEKKPLAEITAAEAEPGVGGISPFSCCTIS